MALVHHDEVEEVGAELLVDVALLFGSRDGLIEREVDLVALVHQFGRLVHRQVHVLDRHLALRIDTLDALGIRTQFGHRALEGPEVIDHGLVDEDVAVGKEEDSLLGAALP
ncbi:hypothetical protein D3C87_1205760 [compost metagenome]